MGKQGKINIPMMLACVLLCLTLITTHLTGGLFARYTAKGEGGDSARVAKWNVAAALLPDPADGNDHSQVDVVCSDATADGEFAITVTNNSEVAVVYDVVISGFGEALPKGVVLKLDDKTATMAADHSITFANAGSLPANAENSGEHKLIFTMTWEDSDLVGNAENREQATLELDFKVNVNVKQVD